MKKENYTVDFNNAVVYKFQNILTDIANGNFPVRHNSDPLYNTLNKESNLFGYGTRTLLGQDRILASTPNERSISVLSPRASVLVKKKAFSNFKANNDLQWLDKTEKMLLRATKALFAYKVTQIRAYESLTKIENIFQEGSELSLNLLVDLFHNAQFLTPQPEDFVNENRDRFTRAFQSLAQVTSNAFKNYDYENIKQDILKILERNAFASDMQLTTWIVDPNDPDNYGTGPGTGVIELGTFNTFNTACNLESSPTSASVTLQDPYRIMYITEGDIEIAIEEALIGSIGILKALGSPTIPVDAQSAVYAGMEILGLGGLDSKVNVDYLRERLRVFYLGKPFINPGDGIHFYIRGNKSVNDFNKNFDTLSERDYFSIDESILEAERILFTNKSIDLDTYKRLRQFSDNSFGMRHVWGGVVSKTSESWSSGQWTLSVDCADNMTWLMWSRFMDEPALQNPQGILEDPLTPYEIKKDKTNTIITEGAPELLDENKELIRSGLLTYDSGLLNGQFATETNLLQGQYNYSGSLSGAKILQHPHGLVYRWKEGILAVTNSLSVNDPANETMTTVRQYSRYYGQQVAQTVLNNLDIANILSILIVGQPYNMESFIDQAFTALNITSKSGNLSPTDPLSAVVNIIRANNTAFGNFQPYRLITLSDQTLLQSANSSILKTETNENIRKLRERIIKLDFLIDKLRQEKRARFRNGNSEVIKITNPVANSNDFIIRSLLAERDTLQNGIKEQISLLKGGGALTSKDIITQNFNLFGKMKTLPLSGNYSADHQITRAMTLVGAQRRIEDVRLNRDKNLFIVSDQYDELTDVRALLLQVGKSDYRIFKGEFVSVYDKCQEAAGFLNLEFFCNTQGHLEFRPPQWNKTPLSILERLFEISKRTGKKIVPDFLTQAFQTRIDSIKREIYSYNIRIVILCLLLDRYPDRSLIPNFSSTVTTTLSGQNTMSKNDKVANASLNFFGVSQKGTGENAQISLRDSSAKPIKYKSSLMELEISGTGFTGGFQGDTETLLGEFDPIFQEEYGVTTSVLTVASQPSGQAANQIANASNLNNLRKAFTKEYGIDPASDLASNNGQFQDSDFIYFKDDAGDGNNIDKASRYLKLLQETISKRDNLVTILKRNKDKLDELEEVEEILSGEFSGRPQNFIDNIINTTKTISSIFNGDATKGSLFDHLVEDDRRNYTGPGSGQRFIIKDVDIVQCSFSEEPPEYCRVDFTGNAPIIGEGTNSATENTYYWAGVVDFDLWRQYGFKHGGSKGLPFANDAETVTKPYALTDIQLQRLKINQGSMTVVGNEYYEPGDIVYVQTKELLYYVRSVTHNYSFSGEFTTNITLEFGHPPGTYLPSPLDIIGQQYSRDSLNGSFITYRNINGDDNYKVLEPDSSIVFPRNKKITEENIALLLDYKDNAIRFTNMITQLTTMIRGNRLVLIRGFITEDTEEQLAEVNDNIAIIKSLLQKPQSLVREKASDILDINNPASFGSIIGNNKGTRDMVLPTGMPIYPIPLESIAEQVVYLIPNANGEYGQTNVKVFNPQILSKNILKNKEVTVDDYLSVYPKGGPKQKTWLDIRSDFEFSRFLGGSRARSISNIIEIGILDVERPIKNA